MTNPVRLTLSRARGFDLQALSLATNGLPADAPAALDPSFSRAREKVAPQAPDEGAACPSCGGGGTVFRCPEWDRSLGECCPAGTTRHDCPGKSIACAACGGTGRAA